MLWLNYIELRQLVEPHHKARKSLCSVKREVERVPAMIFVGIEAVPDVSEDADKVESIIEGRVASCSIDVCDGRASNQLTQFSVSDSVTSKPLRFVQANCPPSVGTVDCARSSNRHSDPVQDLAFINLRACGEVLVELVQGPSEFDGMAEASVSLCAVD